MATGGRPTGTRGDGAPVRVRFGAFELDEENARLTRDRRALPVAPKAFEVLCTLARDPGRLVTKSALLDAVWGHQHVSESVLKTVISELRDALGDDPRQPTVIETVPRRGYRFCATVAPAISAVGVATEPSTPHGFDRPLVGRSVPLARLVEAWKSACSGTRQVFWVAGEPGIGKSTLVDHFEGSLGDARCARGQCVEQHGPAEPYLPVLEALGMLCRDDPSLEALLRSVAPTWMLQLPWVGSETDRAVLHRELAGVGQERMLREFGELLERIARDRPVLLVTEDLHWSDHATLHLVNHFARRRDPARVLWLSTFRLAEIVAFDHPLKALRHELRLHRLCSEVVLEPLSEQDVAGLVALRFPGEDVAESVVRELHARTDGLPLFLVNVMDEVANRDADAASDEHPVARALAGARVPESLAGVIDLHVARLAPEEQRLLQAASLYGVEFRAAALAPMLDVDAANVESACERLAEHGQWLSSLDVTRQADGTFGGRYAFRHALYRHVLYQGLGSVRRAQWHASAAEWLEQARAEDGCVTPAELAVHYEASHQLLRALACYAEAAQSAMRRFAPREALALATRGLDLVDRCPEESQREVLLLTLTAIQGVSSAQAIGVASLEAKRAFEQAREMLDRQPGHPMRGMVLHALGIVFLVRGEYADAIRLGEHMYAIWEQESHPVLLLSACSVLGQAFALLGRNEAACRWLEKGVDACESLGDAALHAAFMVDPAVTLYAALSIPLVHLGRIDEARQRHESAMARARRLREPMAQLVANWFGALFELRLGNPGPVAVMAREMGRLADDAALEQGIAPSEWFGGWAQAFEGSPREGSERILRARQRSVAVGMRSGEPEVLAYAAEAMILAGSWAEAGSILEEAIGSAQSTGEDVYLVQMHILRSRISAARGEAMRARTALLAAAEIAQSQSAPWLELMAWVEACGMGGTDDDVRALKQVFDGISQGQDTALYVRARAVLAAV